jgi:predicted PurR-regulated permease PerM
MQEKITFDKFIRWAGIALLVFGVLFLMNYLSSVLLPFFHRLALCLLALPHREVCAG